MIMSAMPENKINVVFTKMQALKLCQHVPYNNSLIFE